MGKYNRDEVIRKLQNNGLRPVFAKKSNNLIGFEKNKKISVGLKLWAYLDFLKAKIINK